MTSCFRALVSAYLTHKKVASDKGLASKCCFKKKVCKCSATLSTFLLHSRMWPFAGGGDWGRSQTKSMKRRSGLLQRRWKMYRLGFHVPNSFSKQSLTAEVSLWHPWSAGVGSAGAETLMVIMKCLGVMNDKVMDYFSQ